MYIATSSQLKRYDQALLDYGYSIEQLVDKASDCLLKHFDKYQCIMIVCGPGNNGADGISLGIKLHQEGKEVLLCLTGKEEKLSQANRYYLDQAQSLSIECLFVSEETLEEFQKSVPHFDVVVDALFGFGLNSDLRGIVKYVVDLINNIEVDVIAIDIPTGLNPDTGKPYNSCICAYQTITLTAYKLAFLNPESEMYTGKVILELLDAKSFHEEMLFSQPIDFKWAKYHIKERLYDGHKGTYGRIMHVTGCYHYRGAALLAAKAAVYAGSGLVTVWSNEKVIDSLSLFCPEATSCQRHYFDEHLLQEKDAILIGSGLGLNEDSERFVCELLSHTQVPVVIDGDALTILAKHPELLENHHSSWILTPHHGEFKRFVDFKQTSEMVDQANAFAKKYHVTLVLKGPHTLISDENETYRIMSGNKGMSSAGMGDTLAGIISSFLGQGYLPKDAAILGTYLHGLCGDEVYKENYTVVASKVIDQIPQMMKKLKQD